MRGVFGSHRKREVGKDCGGRDGRFEMFDGEVGFARFEKDLAEGMVPKVEEQVAAFFRTGFGRGLGGSEGAGLVFGLETRLNCVFPVPCGEIRIERGDNRYGDELVHDARGIFEGRWESPVRLM